MKETKKRFEFFSHYDHTGIEKHLEKMAAKGWMIEDIGDRVWEYKRTEPQKLKFSVVYYPKKVSSDAVMSDDRESFVSLCETAGWVFVVSYGQMHVFCSENENSVPIETDAEIQVECIRGFAKTEILCNYLMLLTLSVFVCCIFSYGIYQKPIETLSDGLHLFWYCPIFALFSLWNIIKYLIWYKKAKAAAKEGLFTPTKKIIKFEALFCVLTLIFCALLKIFFMLAPSQIIFWLVIAVLAVIMLILFKLICKVYYKQNFKEKSKKALRNITGIILACVFIAGSVGVHSLFPKRSENVFETVNDSYFKHSVIYYDKNLPLDLEDLISVNGVVSKEKLNERLLLVDVQTCNQHMVDEVELGFRYEITYINFLPLYDKCKKEILSLGESLIERGFTYKRDDASLWNADEVYRRYCDGKLSDSYVVCWSDKIVEISFYWEPDFAQISTASAKLMNSQI